MTLGDFRKEHRHIESIHLGQNQGVERAVVRAEGGEHIRVLTHDPGTDLRAHPARGPATPGIVDSSEAGFILEHQAQGPPCPLAGLNRRGKFF